ncbi:hypothetical protein C8J56DRAFT_897859 [Mycena floridula]|nr:hypothetical protein C8J56DRAFT_897859 [Mycena floridula]
MEYDPPLTAEEKAIDLEVWQSYLHFHFSRIESAREMKEEQAQWVHRRHRLFWKAYRRDLLANFWQDLAGDFVDMYGTSDEAVERGISLARYLAETLFDYMVDEDLWMAKGISLDEAQANAQIKYPIEAMGGRSVFHQILLSLLPLAGDVSGQCRMIFTFFFRPLPFLTVTTMSQHAQALLNIVDALNRVQSATEQLTDSNRELSYVLGEFNKLFSEGQSLEDSFREVSIHPSRDTGIPTPDEVKKQLEQLPAIWNDFWVLGRGTSVGVFTNWGICQEAFTGISGGTPKRHHTAKSALNSWETLYRQWQIDGSTIAICERQIPMSPAPGPSARAPRFDSGQDIYGSPNSPSRMHRKF